MCSQTCNTVVYKRVDYTLVSFEESLFDPEAHGITPEYTSTANYRGFVCTWAVARNRLRLTRLSVSVQSSEPPPLFGVEPRVWAGCLFIYDLRQPIPYTGPMTLGAVYDTPGGWDWLPDGRRFHLLHHLVFAEGRLVGKEDRSTEWGRAWLLPRGERHRKLRALLQKRSPLLDF